MNEGRKEEREKRENERKKRKSVERHIIHIREIASDTGAHKLFC